MYIHVYTCTYTFICRGLYVYMYNTCVYTSSRSFRLIVHVLFHLVMCALILHVRICTCIYSTYMYMYLQCVAHIDAYAGGSVNESH